MEPVKLRIKGINSFMEEQEIDFESLAKYGVFGIVGDTGSGKSTIIDAIIIALYDKMPRLGKKDKDYINANVDEAFISFSFKITINGKVEIYLVERGYKREKSGIIKSTISRFMTITSGTKEIEMDRKGEVNKHIENIIGLTYEDFTRAVILPQGKFSQFLVLENKDRRDMLERIFNLEKYGYDLVQKIRSTLNKNSSNLFIIKTKLSALEGITIEEINKRIEIKKTISMNIAKIQEEEKVLVEKLIAERNNISIAEKFKDTTKEMEKLLEKSNVIDKKENDLHNSLKVEIIIEDIKIIDENEKTLQDYKNKKISANNDYESNYKIYKQTLTECEDLEKLKILRYDKLCEELTNAKRAKEETAQLKKKNNELLKSREEYKAKKTSSNKKKIEQKTVLEDIEKTQQLLKNIIKKSEENLITQDMRSQVLNGCELEKLALDFKNKIMVCNKKSEDSAKQIMKLKEESINNKKILDNTIIKLKNLKKKKEKFNINGKAINIIKENLKQGDICPVCGEKIKNSLVIDNDIEEIDNSEIEHNENLILDLNIKIETAKSNIIRIEKENKLIVTEKRGLESELEVNLTNFKKMKEKMNIEIFKDEFIKINTKTKMYEDLKKEIEQHQSAILIKNNELKEIEKNIISDDQIIKVMENDGKALKIRFDEIEQHIFTLVGENNPIEMCNRLEKEKMEMLEKEIELKQKNKLAGEKVQKFLDIKNKIETESKILMEINEKEKALLYNKINELNFGSIANVKNKYLGKETQLEYKNEIDDYRKTFLIIKTNYDKYEKETKNIELDGLDQRYKDLEQANKILTLKKDELNNELGGINKELVHMESEILKVKELEKNKKLLEKDKDSLEVLCKLFEGNKFVEFMAKKHLKYICIEGSKRLKAMTNGKYAIELNNADFIIRDFSRGNIARSPKTLSGGEVFMVSLCLSLALSNKVQLKNNGSLDMFFLDEGFGTLDSNTLEVVMDNLFLLANEKMKIGLITHVEDIKTLLPRKLIVTGGNFEEGSKVKIE